MKVGVIGASGYTGEELLQLLARHPRVEVGIATSRRWADRLVNERLPTLRGRLEGLLFQNADPAQLTKTPCEVFFLTMTHGAASPYARALVDAGKKVIDLSADFRLSCAQRYRDYYGQPHPDVELLRQAAYVLPELSPKEWGDEVPLVACPGCYPTSVLIPLIPLLREGVLRREGIRICSFSGVSGAGRQVKDVLLFCERAESAQAYGLPKHRHLSEIEEQLSQAAGAEVVVQLAPHLAPMRRGIISTITAPAEAGKTTKALYEVWQHYYDQAPFVSLLPSGTFPDSQHTVGSNRIDLASVHDPRTDLFVITSALDNLLKGAASQAVQIMNLWCGFDETTGL